MSFSLLTRISVLSTWILMLWNVCCCWVIFMFVVFGDAVLFCFLKKKCDSLSTNLFHGCLI